MRSSCLSAALIGLALLGCTSSKTATTPAAKTAKNEPTLMTIGSKPVPTSEFAYVYNKNNASAANAYTDQSLKEYLDLYTNFRLKVTEAESMGMDTTAAFKKELEGYKQQLAQPYLTEKSVTDKLVKEAYERMQKEVNASHILINVSPEAEPKDTLAAYNKAVQVRERVAKGEDFAKVAKQVSEDPSAKENGGNLGYFTALQMLYPFEQAAYNTPVNSISNPIRTRYGYHIVKVHNVRPAQGEIKVSHIMIRATPGQAKEDSLDAKRRIDEVYGLLKKGEQWDKLVSQFSEDQSSANNGGELPWFGTGRMIPTFEEAAFALKNPGDLSQPIKTPYGWHIIKLNERKTLPPFAEVEGSLKQKVSKDSRSELNKSAFLKRIKAENKFQEFSPALTAAFTRADSTLTKGTWGYDLQDKKLAVPMFQIQDKKYTIGDFYAYVKTAQRPRKGASPQGAMRQHYDKFVEESLTNYEKANLETKYNDYRMLVKEYRDGILLFQLMDDKVWSKAIEDTVGLKTFFNANQDKYKWDRRAEAVVISAANKDVLNQALSQMKTGRYEYRKNKPEPIKFATGKSTLTDADRATLDKVITSMKNDSSVTAQITVSAEAKEATGKYSDIAAARGKAISSYITSKGIAANRFSTKTSKGSRSATIKLTSTALTTLADNLNQTNALALQVTPARKYQRGDSKLVDEVKDWKPGVYQFEKDGRQVYVQILSIAEPAPKTLNEARGLVTSDYQAYLEKQWLEELRKKYPVQVNQAELQKLVKK